MLARHGALLSPVDAARGYRDLFSSEDAAKKALLRCLEKAQGDKSLRENILRRTSPCGIIKYQVKGERMKPRTALTRLLSSDFRVWLEGVVGELSQFSAS